jgi:anti-sigma factor RsiW
MTACPDQELALHAFADGELDAMATAVLETHLRGCAACREALAEIEAVRAALADPSLRLKAPEVLRARVEALSAPERRPVAPRGFDWRVFGGGGAVGALAATLALFLIVPQMAAPNLPDELVASHVRSLQAAHLVDVATSDRHVVKPWFNGRIDFAPQVPDLAEQGFPLVGGRLDVIDGRTVAALVYKRRLHSINLFVRPAHGVNLLGASATRRDSYSLAHWTAGGLDYWAVSDIDQADLDLFRRTFVATAGK